MERPAAAASSGLSSSKLRSAGGSSMSLWDRIKHRRCRKTPLSELRNRRTELKSKIPPLVGNRSNLNGGDDSSEDREWVNKTLSHFRAYYDELAREGTTHHVDSKAYSIMIQKPDYKKIKQRIGAVPGVNIGDQFRYRKEISLVGLHKPVQAGIDFMNHGRKVVCISIVVTEGGDYTNDTKRADFITYSGQGGNMGCAGKEFEDQTLDKKGNLALENSIEVGNPVRVIRGNNKQRCRFYVYDGLYRVVESRQEKGAHGRLVFKFDLERLPGQASLTKLQLWKLRSG